MRNWLLFVAVTTLFGIAALQYQSTRRLQSEMAALRELLAAQEAISPEGRAPTADTASPSVDRLAAVERKVSQLGRNPESVPPTTNNKVDDWLAKFAEAAAPDRERVQALRQLRRSGGITDDVLSQAITWAQVSTNANTRDDVLSSLEGLTNSILRDPLLGFALNDPNPSVREQAVDSLRRFVNDPNIEAQLWTMINDPEAGKTAIQGILNGPKTPERIAALQERAASPNSSLEERLVAWRALRATDQDPSAVSAMLAQLAQTSQDPWERVKLFKAFDDAVKQPTSRDAVFLTPLMQGLQDSSPFVREHAAKALKDFSSDPAALALLRSAAENDPDSGVRKEAAAAVLKAR